MKDLDDLCKEFEEMDALTYTAVLTEKAKTVIPALDAIMVDDEDGVMLLATFIIGAVVSDGDLSVEEFAVTFPLFHAFFGEELGYAECDYIVRKMRRESRQLKRFVGDMIHVFGQLSEELKNDVVLILLMICAIDGKVSPQEKRWIKKLLR